MVVTNQAIISTRRIGGWGRSKLLERHLKKENEGRESAKTIRQSSAHNHVTRCTKDSDGYGKDVAICGRLFKREYRCGFLSKAQRSSNDTA